MTLLIGINLGECVIIGADTRVNHGRHRWEDGYQKIGVVPTGLIAGAGLSEVHDEVEAALRSSRALNGRQIAETARAACDRRRGRYRINGRDLVDITQFLMTTQAADVEGRVFVQWWTPEQPDALHPIAINRGMPIMPVDTTNQDLDEVVARLDRAIRPIQPGDDLEVSIRYHTRVIGEVVESIAQRSNYVSESFSVGIHFREGRACRVSDVMQRPDDFLRWAP